MASGGRKRYYYRVLAIVFMFFIYYIQRKSFYIIAEWFGGNTSLRNINRLLNGVYFNDAWRPRIFLFALSYISNHWFVGAGLLNDRVLIAREFPALGEVIECYPHNFFLEIGMQFGALPGLAFVAVFVAVLIKRFRSCIDISEKYLVIALFFAGFLPLMLSSSYLSSPMFYA